MARTPDSTHSFPRSRVGMHNLFDTSHEILCIEDKMLKTFINKIFPRKPESKPVVPVARGAPYHVNIGSPVPVGPMSNFHNNLRSFELNSGFVYTGSNRGDFYRYLRDSIPIVSAAVWTWRQLCATPQTLTLDGDEAEVKEAWKIIEDLEQRIHANQFLRGNGINRLCADFFLELFTTGAYAGIIVPYPDGSGIDHFQQIDATRIQWENNGRFQAYLEDERGDKIYLPRDTFFFSALGSDIKNPGGIEPLASIPFVVAVEQLMLEDMARSSHNAGNPRIHVRITPPPRFDAEGDQQYIDRINSYFDNTVNQFYKLEADENLFTWNDVEVKIVGAEPGRSYVWKINREQVVEDVITGLKLFPWALGRSHGATKNWVQAQFNILMQIVDSVQEAGVVFADWLRTTELRMRGNLALPSHRFATNQDPFLLERRQAQDIHFKTVNSKFKEGYITREQALQELGYRSA